MTEGEAAILKALMRIENVLREIRDDARNVTQREEQRLKDTAQAVRQSMGRLDLGP